MRSRIGSPMHLEAERNLLRLDDGERASRRDLTASMRVGIQHVNYWNGCRREDNDQRMTVLSSAGHSDSCRWG
jgi:hypothetical protein